MRSNLHVSSFYKFFPVAAEELAVKKLSLETRAARSEVRGLLILAEEGCNGTVSGTFEAVRFFEQSLPILFGNSDWEFKRAQAIRQPFKDFRVKVRTEICTTRAAVDASQSKNHLSPTEWHELLGGEEEVCVLDVRNRYETSLGKFRNAIDPEINHFSEFPSAVQRLALPKDKKVLMYCTGGIRCEKAFVSMAEQGYENVYQLQGGILNYLEQYPHRDFEGECFVFDGRVAVDQNLYPTRSWKFCPHCGQPGRETIQCVSCARNTVICLSCAQTSERHTCSHDCRYKVSQREERLIANF
jgi:UPF0176 protein